MRIPSWLVCLLAAGMLAFACTVPSLAQQGKGKGGGQAAAKAQYKALGQQIHDARMAGDFARAEEFARERLTASAFQPEVRRGNAYRALGEVLGLRGKYTEAEAVLLEGLPIIERGRGRNSDQAIRLLLSLGDLYTAESRYDEALAALRDALARQLATNPEGQNAIQAYNGLARTELALGRFAEAQGFLLKARATTGEGPIQNRSSGEQGLRSLRGATERVQADLNYYQGNFAEAEKRARGALRGIELSGSGPRPGSVDWYQLLGLCLLRQGQLQNAESAFRSAMDTSTAFFGAQHVKTERAAGGLAQVLNLLGKYEETERLLKLATASQSGSNLSEQRAKFEQAYGQFLVQRGRLPEALQHYRVSLDTIDRIFTQTQGLDDASRESFGERFTPVYYETLQLLLALHAAQPQGGFDRQALDVVSRTQSRLFSEMLRKADAGKLVADANFKGLQAQQSALKSRVQQLRRARAAFRPDERAPGEAEDEEGSVAAPAASAPGDPLVRARNAAAQARMSEELAATAGRLAAVENALWEKFPRYMELTQPRPVTVELLQGKLLKGQEKLLTYFLLPDRTIIFFVGAREFRLFEVPQGRAAIAELISAARAPLENAEHLARLDPGVLHKLYAGLFQPVEALLSPGDRVLVVGDGPMHTLPLEMLVTRWGDEERRAFEAARAAKGVALSEYAKLAYLGERFQFSYLPSLSSFVSVRLYGKAAARYDRELVSFADPVFDSPAAPTRTALASLTRSARSSPTGPLEIARLPETADEAREIAAIVGGKTDLFLRDRAQEHTAKTIDLKATRYLHFATHGLLAGEFSQVRAAFAAEREESGRARRNLTAVAAASQAAATASTLADLASDDAPKPQGKQGQPALVLSLSGSLQGEDGLLTMGEIIETMDLNARLVVLSACNTAGENAEANTGEGFAGLTRAFMYAGARGLVVSHWSVESQSARDLMVELFRGVRTGTDGTTALNRAREIVRASTTHGPYSRSHPYFWAPFVYVGD